MKHKYRTYKNGITGHRYKRYYITAQGRKNYSVLDPQGMTVLTALPAFEDAEWEIDKVTAAPAELHVMRELYQEDISTLQGFLIKASEKNSDGTLTMEDVLFAELVTKIRTRKVENKDF